MQLPAIVQRLNFSEHERKTLLSKSEAAKVVASTKKTVDVNYSFAPRPNLVREFLPYLVWVEIAKELYQRGELLRTRDLLQECL